VLVVALGAPVVAPLVTSASGTDLRSVPGVVERGVAPSAGPARKGIGPVVRSGPRAPDRPLTLADARANALQSSPRLVGLSAEVSSRRALQLQAGLLPNPEIEIDLENVGGTGDREAFEETETTLWLSQRMPLGGKLAGRERVATLAGDLAEWDVMSARREALADATKAFVAPLAAQQRLELAGDLARLVAASLQAVIEQVRAGATSGVEEARARIAVTEAEIERASAERELAASRSALAATWGADASRFGELRGDLADVQPPPALDRLDRLLPEGPEIARWDTELAERRAALALAEAQRIPDPTVRLGARHFHDNDDDALVFEVAVPLPIFDRNQGNVLAASHDLARAKAEREGASAAAAAALAQQHQELARAYEEAVTLERRLVPEARAAFTGVRDGYREGRFGQLDLLTAQQTLFGVRRRHLAALVSYHRAAADIERLTGEPIAMLEAGRKGVR
jgi:cobalt-zinc-cadmium efflux system outer membrane protein